MFCKQLDILYGYQKYLGKKEMPVKYISLKHSATHHSRHFLNCFYSLNAIVLKYSLSILPVIICIFLAFPKALVTVVRSQTLKLDVWDYDSGWPGIMNDDFLGRLTCRRQLYISLKQPFAQLCNLAPLNFHPIFTAFSYHTTHHFVLIWKMTVRFTLI